MVTNVTTPVMAVTTSMVLVIMVVNPDGKDLGVKMVKRT